MADYTIGSLGSLISGKPCTESASKIVFQQVRSRKRVENVGSVSSSSESRSKSFSEPKAVAKTISKGKKIKASLSDALLKKRRPEIAGDESSNIVGKSWRHLPSRGDTSEVDGSKKSPNKEGTFARNAARRVHIKNNTKKHVDDPERQARTIFVGNIPYAHADKKKLMKFFSQYGDIESLRLRCAPLNDPRSKKKVAVIKQEFHPKRTNISAFVVFKTEEEAKNALQADGSIYHAYHLRVDLAGNSKSEIGDPRKSVFVGNLKFETEEEDLWNLFSSCGEIKNVRIVRDRLIGVSKGVAFINFKSSDAAELALELDGEVVGKRPMSVKRYKPNSSPARLSTAHNDKPVKDVRKEGAVKNLSKRKKKEKRNKQRGKEESSALLSKSSSIDLDETGENEVSNDSSPKTSPSPSKSKKSKKEDKSGKKQEKSTFVGQQVKKSKKKKKRLNKNEIKKRKIAFVLAGNRAKNG